MIDSYFSNTSDSYQYPDSSILRNIPDIRDANALEKFEQRMTTIRADEVGEHIVSQPINLAMWQLIHRVLFQDVYKWAGELRTVQLAKGDTVFAHPPYIETEAKRIFDELATDDLSRLNQDRLALRIAYYFGELNSLHPFREGNGRTQKMLFDEIARRAGYAIIWPSIGVDELLQAVIVAFRSQNYGPLERLFHNALRSLSTTHSGIAALIGLPNAGKSTLVNRLVGQKVSIVTPKAQTTRFRVRGVCMEGDTQIVLTDTPGLFFDKANFSKAMFKEAEAGAADADAIVVVVDASKPPHEYTYKALDTIFKHRRNSKTTPPACGGGRGGGTAK